MRGIVERRTLCTSRAQSRVSATGHPGHTGHVPGKWGGEREKSRTRTGTAVRAVGLRRRRGRGVETCRYVVDEQMCLYVFAWV